MTEKNYMTTDANLIAIALLRAVIDGDSDGFRVLWRDTVARTDGLGVVAFIAAMAAEAIIWDARNQGLTTAEYLDGYVYAVLHRSA